MVVVCVVGGVGSGGVCECRGWVRVVVVGSGGGGGGEEMIFLSWLNFGNVSSAISFLKLQGFL